MRLVKIKPVFNYDNELAKTKLQMEQHKQEFISAIKPFLNDWFATQYKRYTDLLDVAYLELSDEQRAELDAIADNLPYQKSQDAINYFNNEKFWWHLSNEDKDHDYYKSIDSLVNDDFRFLLGSLGEALNDFGFIPKYFDSPILGFQCHKDLMNIYRFKYCDPIFWSKDLKTAMDNYWENYKYILYINDINKNKKLA